MHSIVINVAAYSQLYMRNDNIHEHYTRGCELFRVPPGSKPFSTFSARIWNALSHKVNCNVSI